METMRCWMKAFARVLPCVLISLGAVVPSVNAQNLPNTITLDNQSGDFALVKLVGPTGLVIEVPSGEHRTVRVAAGDYYLLVRYGTNPGGYRYTKGDPFTVRQTPTQYSATTITLHKVVGGNYPTHSTSQAEFEKQTVASFKHPTIPYAGMQTTVSPSSLPVYQAQKRLHELGYDPGPLDGLWGRKTQAAVQDFQRHHGLRVSGMLDEETSHRLTAQKSAQETQTSNETTRRRRKTAWERAELRGAVQTVRVETAELSRSAGTWVEGPRVLAQTVAYSSEGNPIEDVSYTTAGKKKVIAFDEQGNMTTAVIYKPDGSIDGKEISTYDAQGNETERAVYDGSGSFKYKWVSAWGAEGKRTELILHYPSTRGGTSTIPVIRWMFTYDAQGRVAEVEEYDTRPDYRTTGGVQYPYKTEGYLMNKKVNSYDAKGNRVEVVQHHIYGAPKQTWRYTYDAFGAMGNWTKRTTMEGKGSSEPLPTRVTYRTFIYYTAAAAKPAAGTGKIEGVVQYVHVPAPSAFIRGT